MEVFAEWDQDFAIDSSGDLLLCSGDVEVRQRLERRLFTAVNGYVWHPEYGAGLPQKIGSVLSRQEIQSVVSSQLALEASVAAYPPAQLTIVQDRNNAGLVAIEIQYWDAQTGDAISFTISN